VNLTPEQAHAFRHWRVHALQASAAVRRREAAAVYARIVLRGWAMVTLVSANTVHLAQGHVGYAALGGWALSALWWQNSSKHREDVPYAGAVYGLGAALGTVTGATIARLIGG
jgi:hypothetical protein